MGAGHTFKKKGEGESKGANKRGGRGGNGFTFAWMYVGAGEKSLNMYKCRCHGPSFLLR